MEIEAQAEIAHATVRSFIAGIAATPHSEVLGLVGSASARLLAGLLVESPEPLLILASDNRQVEQFAADLAFYHGRPEEIFTFPHWEIRPYDPLTPHPEVEAARLATLAALHAGQARAVVLSVRALLQKVIPREVLAGLCQQLLVEEEYPRPALMNRLIALGYQGVPLVEDRGTFSLRGDILDLFPPTGNRPVRIEFFGDWVERMRPFDPAGQRTGSEELKELLLLPAREMILAGSHVETFARRLKERCDALEIGRQVREAVIEEAREGLLAPGRCFLLPFNYDRLDSFFDYAPTGTWAVLDPPAVEQEADRFAGEAREGENAPPAAASRMRPPTTFICRRRY